MLDAGAQPIGDPRACHAIAVDARAPKFDGGIVTRLDCIPLGIVVNQHGERFADEGEDLWPKRYASWGASRRAAAGAAGVLPARRESREAFMPSVFPPIVADTIPELADASGSSARSRERHRLALQRGRSAGHVQPRGARRLPHAGLRPRKATGRSGSTRRRSGDIRLRPGITFTYLGLRWTRRCVS